MTWCTSWVCQRCHLSVVHMTDDALNRWRHSGRPMWYDRHGNPVDVHEAERLLASPEHIIAQDRVGPFFVSTVHLVLDHSLGGNLPLLFETAVFDETTHDRLTDMVECDRTPTEAAALATHAQVVAKIRDQLAQDRHAD